MTLWVLPSPDEDGGQEGAELMSLDRSQEQQNLPKHSPAAEKGFRDRIRMLLEWARTIIHIGGGVKYLYAVILIVVLLAVGVFYFGSGDDLTETFVEEVATSDLDEPTPGQQETVDDPETIDTGSADEGATVSSVADADESSDEGPLSGIWTMLWTNKDPSNPTESEAFTIRFNGVNSGTVEILNDETEIDTAFEVNGNKVSFIFTRVFELSSAYKTTDSVLERSLFDGELVDEGAIIGKWQREGWDCQPERSPNECETGDWVEFNARLVLDD